MTPVELLQDKFYATGCKDVTEWMKQSKVNLSLQTCTTILLRGTEKGLLAMLTLAVALKCSDEEIKWIAQEKGDKSFWRLITKETINSDEQKLLDDYRQLTSQQKQLIDSMIQQMRSQP